MGNRKPDTYIGTLSIAEANRLVEQNIGLLRHFVKLNIRCGLDVDEITSLAGFGMVHASRTWDPRLAKFSTWSFRVMGGTLRDYMVSRKCKSRILDLMADKLPRRTDGLKIIGREDDPADIVERDDTQATRMRIAFRQMDPRAKRIIRMRFWKGMTLQEVSDVLGITRERVRQIEIGVLERCRRAIARREHDGRPLRARRGRITYPACQTQHAS